MAPQKRAGAPSRPSPRSSVDSTPLRVVLYPRVSGDGQTIATQIATMVPYVERRAWSLVRPPETYQDDGISAADGHLSQRAGLLRLLADAGRGAFDAVAVVNVDRLSRADDLIERYAVLGEFQRAGVLIADAHSGSVYDLNTEDGALYVGLGAHFAARDRRKILEQMERGRRFAIGEGRKPRGVDPYGYQLDRATGRLVLSETEAAVVRSIFARIAAGASCADVARDLNARGVALRARRNAATLWTRPRVYQIARAPIYRGEYAVLRGEGLAIAVPPVVDAELWTAVQRALSERRTASRTRGPAQTTALAQGRARCEVCGAPVWLTRTQKRGRVIARYYACLRRLRAWPGPRCTARYRRVDEVDGLLWRAITDALASGWRALADEIQAAEDADPDEERGAIERLERRVAHLERAQAETLRLYRRGAIEREARDRELGEIKGDLVEARATLAGLRERAHAERWTARDLEITVEGVRARLESCTPAERRDIVRALIPGRGRRVVTIGERVSAVLCLDPRTLGMFDVSFSTENLTASRSLPPLEMALAA